MTKIHQCLERQEWDDYIVENNGHPLQLWGWGSVKTAHNWQARRFFVCDNDGSKIGAAQVLIRKLPWPLRSIAYIPRGPVVKEGDLEKLLSALSTYIKENCHSVALSIEPDVEIFNAPKDWIKSANRILPAQTIILDLTKSDSELLCNMSKKTRQYIRKSASETITIKKIRNHDELSKCLEIYHETAKRAGFDVHDNQYYYDIFDKMGDHSPIFASFVNDQPIAFLWLAISANTAFELYGGMNEQGQQSRANYALKWHAIRKCKEWGLSRYDFGGLIEGGVSTFKMNWTDQATELAGTFDLPLSFVYGLWSRGFPAAKLLVRKIKSTLRHN